MRETYNDNEDYYDTKRPSSCVFVCSVFYNLIAVGELPW